MTYLEACALIGKDNADKIFKRAEKKQSIGDYIDKLLFGLLQIVFITLKLCGVIDWNWFWVFSPILIPLIIIVILTIIFGIIIFYKRRKMKKED